MCVEIRKNISWYNWWYQVSNLWKIKSFYLFKTTILSVRLVGWYNQVMLYKNKIGKNHKVHRLKAIAFIPNPENKPCINHRDWNKLNNGMHADWNDNLEWCTISENVLHSYRVLLRKHHSLWKFWKHNSKSKSVLQYNNKGKLIRVFWSLIDVQRELWYNVSSIWQCCRNWNQKTAYWFLRKFIS